MNIGTWQIIPSIQVSSVLAHNLDFVILDREHGNASYEDIFAMCAVIQREGCLCYARPSSNNEAELLHLMDSGVDGIIIPHVQTVEDVEKFIQYTTYPPLGSRGYTPYVYDNGYSRMKNLYGHKEARNILNSELYRGIIIEDEIGYNNLPEILLQDIDMIYIGIYDLSVSMGLEITDKKVMDMFDHIVKMTLEAEIDVGAIFHSKIEKLILAKKGVTHACYKTDTAILFDFIREIQE